MNEELLGYAYELIQGKGYNGSMEDFVVELEENEDLQNVSYELLKSGGYDANEQEFIEEVGLGKPSDVAEIDATVTSEPKASEKIEGTDLKLVNGSLERVQEDPDGGVQSLLDQYKTRTQDDPSNYNVDNEIGQFLIDKVAGFTSGALSILGGAADIIEMGGDVAAAKAIDTYNFFADDENDFTQEEKNKIAGNIEKAFALDDLLYIGAEASSKLMTKRDDSLGEGISGAFKEGNYLEGVDRLLSGVFQAAPSVVAAVAGPVGLGIIGASATAQHYEEKTENNAESRGLVTMLVSMGQGGIELGSEYITRGLFRGSNKLLPAALNSQLAKTMVGKLTGGMFTEAFSETASEEINNAIDLNYGIDKFYDKDGNFDTNRVMTRVIDTGLISAVIGGAGTGGNMLSDKGKAYEADRLMSPAQDNKLKKLQQEIAKQKAINTGQDIKDRNEEIAGLEAKQKKATTNNRIVVDNLSKEQKLEMFKLIDSNTELSAANENSSLLPEQIKSNKKLITKNKRKLNTIYKSKLDELVKERQNKTIEFAKGAGILDLNITVTELKSKDFDQKAKDFGYFREEENEINSNKNFSEAEKKQKINELTNKEIRAGAVVDPNTNEIFINVDKLIKLEQLNAGSHEILHPILNKLVGSNAEQGKIVEDFKNNLDENQKNVMEDLMSRRGYKGKSYNTEYFTVFSDAIQDGEISYNENFGTKIKDFLQRIIQSIAPQYTKDLSFKDGKEAYDFMREYTKSAKEGKISDRIAKAVNPNATNKTSEIKSDEGNFSKAENSKTRLKKAYEELEQIDETEANFTQQPEVREKQKNRKKELLKIVENENVYEELRLIDEFEADFKPTEASKNRKQELLDKVNKEEKEVIGQFSKNEKASAEVQRLFNEKPRDWEVKVIEQMRPITAKLVERRRDVTGFDREELLRDFEVGERGIFDLIRSYDPSKNDSLAAYINTFLSFRAQESSKRILKPVFESDVTEERGVAAQEDDISIEDAIDESFKPTKEQKSKLRREIKLPDEQVEKVRQAVRKTFGTRLPPPQSTEFKKALRKAFDVELFKELKTNVFKTRDEYRNFLRENWKALYDAIPQETLNQSFATFREPVLDENGKQKREKTPEGERIFRKKNITREDFLDYFFSTSIGGSTRGTRKDAIVRMLAQELGFDATMETVKEPKVAEKIEFANPDIKIPELSETINREQDGQFSNAEIVKKYNLDEDIYTIFDKKSKNKKQDVEKVNKYMDIWIKYLTKSGFPPGLINATQINAVITRKYPGKKQSNLRNSLKLVVKNRLKNFEKENYIKEFKAPPKVKANSKFGSSVTGKKWDKLSNEKEVEKYVNQSKDNFLSFWSEGINGTYNSLTNQKDKKEFLGLMSLVLESNQREGSTAHRAGAEVIAKIKKDFEYDGRKNATGVYIKWYENFFSKDKSKWKRLDWEHAVSSVYSYKELLKSVLNGNFEDVFSKIVPNYTQIPVPPIIQKVLKEAGYEHEVPSNFDLSNPKDWVKKYINPKVRAELKKAGLSENWFQENIITLDGSKSFFNKEGKFTVSEKTKKKSKLDIDLEKANSKINKEFNKILEDSTSIAASETVSDVKARLAGEKKTKFRFFIPPSADDLMGLLYYTLGKGKIGDAQLKWYNENIISPFAQAMEAVSRDRNETARRFNKLVKDLGIIPKKLRKEIPGEPFTQEQAIRVYVWDKQGMSIPGLSKAEKTKLVKYINDNKQLREFSDKLLTVNKGFEYAKPTESWTAGTITSDLKETSNTTKRAAFLTQWQKNVDVIFSKQNLNKLEAAYGREYRLAMENMLQRMKTGRNRDFAGDKLTTRFVDWINGSVGAIMFFNTRSAILQTLSAVNFINFSDNNIFAAAKAFSNQKQYWSDFSMLFNSDFLVDRRQGLRMDINEADLATAAKQGGAKGVISKLLKLGFTPTQLADSFAIAAGGSTFYRNRLQSLIKEGMDQKAAEKIAFQEFRETAEESQQSSRPDKISQQQAGPLGRVILAFANTPSQYARITKKAFLDLKNGRGDAKTNISKIVYYTFAQNLIFNALQQALFAISFADNDEEEEKLKDKKMLRIANGMADSVLRGLGFGGAIASTVKNIALKINEKSKKKNPEYQDIALDILKISPPISSKITKLRSAARAYDWNKKEMMEEGVSIDNPAALALGEITSAITNIPLDRAIRKVQNVDASINDDLDFYQRLALLGGWNKWDLGIQNKKKKKKEFKPIKSTDSGRLIIKIK